MRMRTSCLCVFLFLSAVLFANEKNEDLWNAARNGDAALIQKLLDDGVDVNAKTRYGATALSFAADRGHEEVISILLENGGDPNIKDSFYNATPFLWAASEGHFEIVEQMIAHGADLSTVTPLQWAAFGGNVNVVRLMLENDAPGAKTVLMRAIENENPDLARAVLEAAKLEDTELSEALAAAKEKDFQEIVQTLIALGAKDLEPSTDSASELEKYVGEFQSDVSVIKIELKNGSLILNPDSGNSIALIAKEGHVFDLEGVEDSKVVFQIEDNMATGFRFEQSARNIVIDYKRKQATEAEADLADISELMTMDSRASVESPRNWASFRGNHASGVADGQYPPTVWNADDDLNVLWKTAIPGLSHASPIVWEDRVFVATVVSGDTSAEYRVGLYGDVDYVKDMTAHVWQIYCLDRKNGDVLWQKEAYRGTPRVKRHTKATQANSTPATNGKYVVALFGSEGLSCYDLDGNLIWQKDLGVLDAGWFYDEEVQWGHASSPIIYRNSVIVQCDRSKESYVAAFELSSGKEIWRTERDEIPSWGTPTVYTLGERDELITNSTGFIYAYEPATGKELWRHKMDSEITVATPVVTDSMIYVTSGYPPSRPVIAIRPGGQGDISLPDSIDSSAQVAWRQQRGGTYMPTPIFYQGYFYTCNNNGILTCYDAKTGEQKYRSRVAGRARFAFTASPVAADGKLYFASEEGDVFVLKAGPTYELIAKNSVGEILMATPAISNGIMFVRGQHHLFAFGSR